MSLHDRGETLAIGKQRYLLRVSSALQPELLDANGQRLDSFPAIAHVCSSATQEQHKEAEALYHEVSSAMASLRATYVPMLEERMLLGMPWPQGAWEQDFVEQPLLRKLAGALIWRAEDGSSFRPGTDGHWLNAEGREIAVLPGLRYLWHPAMEHSEAEAWRQHFSDGALDNPLRQLLRPQVVVEAPSAPADLPAATLGGLLEAWGFHGSANSDRWIRLFPRSNLRVIITLHVSAEQASKGDAARGFARLHTEPLHAKRSAKLPENAWPYPQENGLPLPLAAQLAAYVQQLCR